MRGPTPLVRTLALYGALFAAFGVASPFLPGLLRARGLSSASIGVVLGAGSAIRLVAGPLGGRIADRTGAARLVLAACLAAAAVVALGYGPARGLWVLLGVSAVHAALLAPLTPLADTLALRAAAAPRGFDYGWVRGAGSGAFILGTIGAGQAVAARGLPVIIWLNAGLLAVAAVFAMGLPDAARRGEAAARDAGAPVGGMGDLLRIGPFMCLMGVVALVGGSHALHDAFEVIRWHDAGLGSRAAGLLWGESVGAEMLVFFVLGGPLIDRIGVRGAAMLSAGAGVLRWGTAARTAALPAMALVEPLHGFTFALLHLVCMRMIGAVVPPALSATAQAFYATLAMGASTTVLTFAAGPLYGHLHASAFWVMAGLCAAALPLALRLPRRVAA